MRKNLLLQQLGNTVNEFRSFDKSIINYMAMHWVGGSLLIYSALLPIFMNRLGVSLVTAGAIFSVAALVEVIFTFALRKTFDKISPNVGMSLDWVTESFPAIIFGLATTSFHFFLGAIASRFMNILNPVYKVYENEIYPEGQRSLIYTYHLVTPEFFTILLYPVVGYLLTYKFTSIMAFRVIFLICGVGYLFVALIPWKGLRWVEPVKLEKSSIRVSFPRELYLTAFAEILVLLSLSFTPTLITSYYIMDKMNGTVLQVLLLPVFTSILLIVTGLVTKNLNEYISEAKVAQYSIVFFAMFAVLMIVAKSYWMIVLANIFMAIGNIIWFPNHYSLMMKYIPKERRGEFFGGISSLIKLLGIVVPYISAILVANFGFFVPFLLALGGFTVAFVIYQVMVKSVFAKDNVVMMD